MLIVRDDVKLIPRETAKEKTFLFLVIHTINGMINLAF